MSWRRNLIVSFDYISSSCLILLFQVAMKMAMANLILFIVTTVPMYHGELMPRKPSKQSSFCATSVRAIIFELDYNFCFLRRVVNLVNVRLKEEYR